MTKRNPVAKALRATTEFKPKRIGSAKKYSRKALKPPRLLTISDVDDATEIDENDDE